MNFHQPFGWCKIFALIALILRSRGVVIHLVRVILLRSFLRRRFSFEELAQQVADHWSRYGAPMGHFAGSAFVERRESVFGSVRWGKSGEPGSGALLLFRSPLRSSGFTGHLDVLNFSSAAWS